MSSPNKPTPQVPKSRFRLGMFFLVLNYLFGWPFLLIIESAAIYYEDPSLGIIGAVGYGISWALLGIAVWLAGPGILEYVKQKFAKYKRIGPKANKS